MPVRTSAWPIEALPFEEVLTPIVESFLDAEEPGAFEFSRSAIQQLYDRVNALGALPRENLLIALIRDRLGEFNCLAICNSGFREPRTVPFHDGHASVNNRCKGWNLYLKVRTSQKPSARFRAALSQRSVIPGIMRPKHQSQRMKSMSPRRKPVYPNNPLCTGEHWIIASLMHGGDDACTKGIRVLALLPIVD